ICYCIFSSVYVHLLFCFVFFFQAEDGIRDRNVTGVQTCALPICAADVVLNLSSATNGKLSQKSYEDLEQQTGMPLKDISSERASEKISFLNITAQPREVIPTAVFLGSNKNGQRYSPFTTNVESLVPFIILT